ncbi:Signal transduction histidine kinase [Ohtaekwangia koreensis]|uniref:histidine kinase n=2 Tax=Ohtaekwangia koreensis TaxID=688867 RepID=A0A1T5LPB6_9BACT|nr:Signal transduction histidine kinase [Ohtaekwangia koreensis]
MIKRMSDFLNRLRILSRVLTIAMLLVCTRGFGQHEFRFESITVDDGLSQSAITSITQDKFGYLWVSTLDGLNRYDGKSFYTYRTVAGDSNSLLQNNVEKLFLDQHQQLWVFSVGSLSRYRPEKNDFVNHTIHVGNDKTQRYIVREFIPVSADEALLCTQLGMLRFNVTTGAFTNDKSFSGLKNQNLFSIYIAADSSQVVMNEHDVYIRISKQAEWKHVMHHDESLQGSYQKSTGKYYLQSRDSIYQYDARSHSIEPLAALSPSSSFERYKQRTMQRTNGDVWVLHGNIDIFDSTFQHRKTLSPLPDNPNGIPDYLSCAYESRDGVVWIGSNGMGLAKYNPLLSIFKYIGKFPGTPVSLSNQFVKSIYTPDDIHLYVATLEGLDVINLNQNITAHYRIPSVQKEQVQINKIVGDHNNNIWLCTTHGLMRFDGKKILPSPAAALNTPDIYIYDCEVQNDNALLLATKAGVIHWDQARNLLTTVARGTMLVKKIKDIYWIEQQADIQLFQSQTSSPYRVYNKNPDVASSFPKVWPKCFYEDKEGTLWIGTWGAGLVRFNAEDETFQHFDEKDGLPNNVVYGILEDDKGHFWLSTNRGLSIFDKAKGRAIRNFFRHDGLQGDEFNTRAFYKSPSGKMYFGGINGLTFFEPEEALSIAYPLPQTIVTGLFINSQRVDILASGQSVRQVLNDTRLVLSWSERNFGFEVIGLGFTSPSRTQYKFILEDFMDDWAMLGNRNDITFTNIPPGEYILRVKSSNSFGEWEEDGLRIYIVVKGPFWKTPAFIGILVFLATGIAYAIYYLRVTKLKREAATLENIVHQRTRELQLRNEEVAAQNEEILMQNEELKTQSESIDFRNQELLQIRNSLEERVVERTLDLQKLNKELVDQNTQLEQFTFITAHNIRGPLARIKGLIHLMDTDNQEQITEYLKTSVSNLDDVINDLNQVLTIRKGAGIPFELVSLHEQFDLALDTLKEDIAAASATVQHEGIDDALIYGLKPYAYSIFYNLIHNALKYRSTRRPLLIRCKCLIQDDKVRITVSDNGIGIDMQYARDKIFNLYQRFHANTAGKGFGLYLVKTQVEVMGGTITADSIPDKGTTFIITFPLKGE